MREKFKTWFKLSLSKSWQHYYKLKVSLASITNRYSLSYRLLITASFTVVMYSVFNFYSESLNSYFWDRETFKQLQAITLGLGTALAGATVLTFSFIMFSVQVNVERLSHGLFGKFSFDKHLIFSFIGSFSLAVVICSLSLLPNYKFSSAIIIFSGLSIALIISLFIYSYKRSLKLINPINQLNSIVTDVKKNHTAWIKAYNRTKDLITLNEEDEKMSQDMRRLTYFSINSHWINYTQQSIKQCIAVSRAYCSKGDEDVSSQALSAVVAINGQYLAIKGNTFFAHNGFIDNPLATDSFINFTLEEIRQNIQFGQSNNNESYILQNLRCIFELSRLYYTIEYKDKLRSMSHAHIAQQYLYSAIEEVCIPNNKTELILEGVRLLGKLTLLEATQGRIESIPNITEKLKVYSLIGLASEKQRYITQLAIEQLSSTTLHLIINSDQDLRFVAKELANAISFSSLPMMKLNEAPFSRFHSHCYSAFLAGTSMTGFLQQFTQITNHVCSFDAEDDKAQQIVGNIIQVLDEFYDLIKKLFIQSIETKSSLLNDVIHWLTHVIKCLIGISNSVNVPNHSREQLDKVISWYIHIFSWVPKSNEAVQYAENYSLTDNIFEALLSMRGYKSAFNKHLIESQKLFLSWGKKAGHYGRGWGTVNDVIVGNILLDILEDIDANNTLSNTLTLFEGDDALPPQTMVDLINHLNEESNKYRNHYGHSVIGYNLARVNQEELDKRLNSVAEGIEQNLKSRLEEAK